MASKWEELSDNELADAANRGLGGQGAVVESNRRLRVELVKQQESTNRLTWALVWFTLVLLILGAIQIYLIWPRPQ